MKRYCLTLDLKDESDLIEEYVEWHKHVWPEVIANIKLSGIRNMEIYRYGNRLFMIMETDNSFSFEKKAILESKNKKVKDWEDIMWKYQKQIPGSKEGEKWILMNKIFSMCEPVDNEDLTELSHS